MSAYKREFSQDSVVEDEKIFAGKKGKIYESCTFY